MVDYMHSNRRKEPSINSWRNFRDYLIILLLLALFSVASFSQLTQKLPYEKTFILKMNVTYENKDSREIWNLTESDRSLGLFFNNSWQRVYLVNVSSPIERLYHDPDGNIMALLNFSTTIIGPGEKISYNATYKLVFEQRILPAISEGKSGTLDDIPEDLKRVYCKPTGLWQSNDLTLKEKAMEIVGNETRVLVIVKKFVEWITNNIRYKPSEVPRYPNETISIRMGDCDDQANLLITFCRAIGIPAYLQIGCIYMPHYDRNQTYWDGHLIIKQINIGWHGWALVYVPPWGWLPADLTYVEGNLRKEPLNAIRSSAVMKHYTFHYMNVTETDYISESRAARKFLEAHEFYVYEKDYMMELTVEESTVNPIPIIIIYLTMLLSVLVIHHLAFQHFMPWMNANNLYVKASLKNYLLRGANVNGEV